MSLKTLLQEMEEASRMEIFAVASNGSFRRLLKVRVMELDYQLLNLAWEDAQKLQHQYCAIAMQKDELERVLEMLDDVFKEFGTQLSVDPQEAGEVTTTAAQENGNASASL